jgi:hypothetical protein
MMNSTLPFLHFLQSCLTPVALISGVGLLLLTITNRLGRTIDRIRHLVNELDNTNTLRRNEKQDEIKILFKRGRYLQNSIIYIVISIISSGFLIPVIFTMHLFGFDLYNLGYILFFISILAILISSVYFFLDIILTLHALKLEAKDYISQ